MGNRIIKESICVSEQIDELDWMEEVFFYRLIVNCDDYGVMDGRTKILKAKLMPLKDISLEAVQSMVDTLVRVGLIRMYTVDLKPYIQLIKWGEHQRVRDSRHRYPMPDAADSGELTQAAAENVGEKHEETEQETVCGDLRRVAANCCEDQRIAAECGSRARPRAGAESNTNTNPNPNPNPTRAGAQDTDPGFDRFWSEYPNKVKKPNALKAWGKLKPDEGLVEKIMQGLARWKKSDQWTRDGGQFIPHPATWLNGRQWEDEVRSFRQTKEMPAHQFTQRTYDHEDEIDALAMKMYGESINDGEDANYLTYRIRAEEIVRKKYAG